MRDGITWCLQRQNHTRDAVQVSFLMFSSFSPSPLSLSSTSLQPQSLLVRVLRSDLLFPLPITALQHTIDNPLIPSTTSNPQHNPPQRAKPRLSPYPAETNYSSSKCDSDVEQYDYPHAPKANTLFRITFYMQVQLHQEPTPRKLTPPKPSRERHDHAHSKINVERAVPWHRTRGETWSALHDGGGALVELNACYAPCR
ncbi:hypothetical protein BDU57DRAFT_515738 [Ampelomyces quisqualis]|uniref:Uncharacterized protein n=1 Tax=Ampelomyces quisqualis TaxID=50730 RepID=A0A6A5QK09_AMPQU|nr:hypothetical protein BDU57DRAFT_515738 [Ampelomyces quisqualis]